MPEPISDLLPLERLAPYLASVIPGFEGPVSAEKTEVGQSNPTFVLTTASGRYVLRRKPSGTLLKSAHAVEREHRVMAALAGTDVPVPVMRHLCEDVDVIGAVFFVMDFVAGRTLLDPRVPEASSPEDRAAIFDDMNRCLAALHSVDIDAVGLSDFGPQGNYFVRQTERWTKQYRASETETIAEMDQLIDWLAGNMPEDDGKISLVHGDWRIDNLRYMPDTPRVAAVLDWELSTLGHPMADVGAQLMQWQLPPGDDGRGLAGIDRKALGIPEDKAYVETYAQRAGLGDVPDLTFCLVFSFFKMAAIIQGVKKRALDGNASNPERGLAMGAYVPLFAQKALTLI